MLASHFRLILQRGSLESRLLSLQIQERDDFPCMSHPRQGADQFVPTEGDQGYFTMYDFYLQRDIYVCEKEIATNVSFLSTMKIENLLDLSKEPEYHYFDQTPIMRQRVLDGIVHSLKLLMTHTGNVVVHCRHGRTRSPAFLVAYLMIVACLSLEAAHSCVSSEYRKQRYRREDIDRLGRYTGNLKDLIALIDPPVGLEV